LPSAATAKLRGAPSVKFRVRAFWRGNESAMAQLRIRPAPAADVPA